MTFLSKILEHPAVIGLLYFVGFYNIVYPEDDWSFYLGIFIVIAATINLIRFIKKKPRKM